jgi:nitrate/nitrite transporter NarK
MLRKIAQLVSWLSLVALVAPSLMFLAGKMELDRVKTIMLFATIVWFISASLWMWNSQDEKQQSNA